MILLRPVAISVSFALTVLASQPGGYPAQEPFSHPGPPHQRPEHTPPGAPPHRDPIYQVLSADPQFSKLVKIINFSNDTVALLNDTFAGITFFAPTNEALQPPHKRRHPRYEIVEDEDENLNGPSYTFSDILPLVDDFGLSAGNDSDKKEWIAKLVKTVASYHVLSDVLFASALAQNTTFASNLTVLTKRPLRVRVESLLLPPGLYVNLFSKVVQKDIIAGNGVIHAINHPLFPPPPAFAALYNFPGVFGTLTSALQRSGLTLELDIVRHRDGKKSTFEGAKTVTFFAPNNKAFERLPIRLRLFLFSYFGANALKKLLEYHIVPEVVIHSDYFYNVSVDASETSYHPRLHDRSEGRRLYDLLRSESGLDSHHNDRKPIPLPHHEQEKSHRLPCSGQFPHNPPVFAANMTLATLLPNATLQVNVAQFKSPPHLPGEHYTTRMYVNGHAVALADLPMVNGAVHAIDRLLVPPHHKRSEHGEHKHDHHGDKRRFGETHEERGDGWEDWEDWFIQWVNEN